jgi:hypothetical protein
LSGTKKSITVKNSSIQILEKMMTAARFEKDTQS